MKTSLLFALTLSCGSYLSAQQVISAHSGLLHYVDGYGATIDGRLVSQKLGEYPLMKDGETLESENARVEILLNPGVFLRLDKHSSVQMVKTQLADTRVKILSGSAVLEADDLQKGNSLMLLFQDAKITPTRHGLFRVDVAERRFRVVDGEAQVIVGDQVKEVKGGHQVEFGAVLAVSRFNRKLTDPLDNWAAARSQQIVQANIASANMVSHGGTSSSYTNSSWVWNAYYGLITFLPARGYGYNPYGWRYYSPSTIGTFYYPTQPANTPQNTYAASNGAGDGRSSLSNNSMTSGAAVSANPSVAAAAPDTSSAMSSMSRGSVSGGGGRGR